MNRRAIILTPMVKTAPRTSPAAVRAIAFVLIISSIAVGCITAHRISEYRAYVAAASRT